MQVRGRCGWALYSEGFWQQSFGPVGGGFCAHSFTLLIPKTLRWDTVATR